MNDDRSTAASLAAEEPLATPVGDESAAGGTGSHERIVLMNRLISSSVTRGRDETHLPIHAADELLRIIMSKRGKPASKVYVSAWNEDDAARAGNSDYIFLRDACTIEEEQWTDAVLLLEYVKADWRRFPVVDTTNHLGRELEGNETERGAKCAYVVVRMPRGGPDNAVYKCVLDYVSDLSRRRIEHYLCRLLRDHAREHDFKFPVSQREGKKGKPRLVQYYPKVELGADFGRKVGGSLFDSLSLLVFTKRRERQAIGRRTAVRQNEFMADFEVKVSAKEAPTDPEERKGWIEDVRQWFKERGYGPPRLYYRHVRGRELGGRVHEAVDGMADLLMCRREHIVVDAPYKMWEPAISLQVAHAMRELFAREELWEKAA